MKAPILLLLLLLTSLSLATAAGDKLDQLLRRICDNQELKESYKLLSSWKNVKDARSLFLKSALELILHSNVDQAVALHKQAKSLGTSTMPPLAEMYLKGESCGGLGDLYYVAAVITKQMVDLSNSASPPRLLNHTAAWYESLTTLITLTSDSGLHEAAEAHWTSAWAIASSDLPASGADPSKESQLLSLLFRGCLMTPAIYTSSAHINATRALLLSRLDQLEELVQNKSYRLQSLDEFSLSTTFYLVYQGLNDASFLQRLHHNYHTAFPSLKTGEADYPSPSTSAKLRVGFVSSYFRRHSICKLFCGLVHGLAQREDMEVFVFSSMPASKEDASTQALRQLASSRTNFHFVSVDKMLVSNRKEVLHRNLDVLVYLDVGMEPASVVWAGARLAAVQLCVWGHPTTTGLASVDYFVSSAAFHRHRPAVRAQEAYSEQLVLLPHSPGLAFPALSSLPSLPPPLSLSQAAPLASRDAAFWSAVQAWLGEEPPRRGRQALASLVQRLRAGGAQALLCPQFAPKIHPAMDEALLRPLLRSPRTLLVMLGSDKKAAWRRAVTQRWTKIMPNLLRGAGRADGAGPAWADRVVWMPDLDPQEYLVLLSLGAAMLDPFPFGGGVTALEALAVCTPVVTLPAAQHVPQLAAGLLAAVLNASGPGTGHDAREDDAHTVYRSLVAEDVQDYVHKVDALATDPALNQRARNAICRHRETLFGEHSETTRRSVQDWTQLLQRLGRTLR